MASKRDRDVRAAICSNRQRFVVRVHPTDITTCIHVTRRQQLLTVISILLVISDIPRTGFTIRPRDFYALVGPGIVMYWGPYEYHIAHLKLDENAFSNSTDPTVKASCDGTPVESLELWSYKHDTLSIAPRAVAKSLNMTSYPPCVLYREPCQALTLDPRTVFDMLDELATVIHQRWFFGVDHPPIPSFTISNWVDRLHHFLLRFVAKHLDVRLHVAYHASLSSTSSARNSTERPTHHWRHVYSTRVPVPFIGANAVKWLCEHPLQPDGSRTVPIWDHIDIRIEDLARRYPDLELDLTMLSSSFIEQTTQGSQYVPSASYLTDTIEVTTVVRGRRCDPSRNCRTVFVDDYRYERSWIESEEVEWARYVWLLRGSAQLYIWIRVALLFVGCISAATFEPHHRYGRFVGACSILVRIPGHIIVYGSWYPLLAYVLAHIFDSSLIQTIGEFAWSTIGGFYSFNLIQYTATASIQMRNIWMIALLWKLTLALLAACTRGRHDSINPIHVGILSVRSGLIALVSWLTTFALMRALHFRDTDIVSVTELPRHIDTNTARSTPPYCNTVDYGPRFDLKCLLLATVVAFTAGWIAKALVRIFSGRGTAVFMSRSRYIPLSAGRVWSGSVLNGVWAMQLWEHQPGDIKSINAIMPMTASGQVDTPPVADAVSTPCDVCSFRASSIHWRATRGCAVHEPIFDIPRRTDAIWSMVRLTNIAAMTDPVVLFRLRVVGVPLFVYRVNSGNSPSPDLILLPLPPSSTQTTEVPGEIVYVAAVNSRDVPWHVLINCG